MLPLNLLLVTLATAAPSQELTADRHEATSKVTLGNEMVRLCFQPAKPGQFDVFPKGYAGYCVEMADRGVWTQMATVDYFTAFCHRCAWGRDWLYYVTPDKVTLDRGERSASAVFSRVQWDIDGGRWEFTFKFTVRPGSPVVDVTCSAVSDGPVKLMSMWGPRLCVGEGSFGADKDEALFAGLEYLGRNERSSANPALAPDAQKWFVPSPAKITIPLMSVLHQGRLVGIMWNPLQKWANEETCPSAVFASPNWIESRQHHLLGLFVPGVPKHVAENSLRAHTPADIPAGSRITITAKLFAMPAEHSIDAVNLYLKEQGGVPQPTTRPMSPDAAVELCTRGFLQSYPASQPDTWPAEFGPGKARPLLSTALGLIEAAHHLTDATLKQRAETLGRTAMRNSPYKTVGGALRTGGLAEALRVELAKAREQVKGQQPDGSWSHIPTKTDEQGLMYMHAPPWNKQISEPGATNQGMSAGGLAELLSSVLTTGDEAALSAAVKGLEYLDSFSIPFVYGQSECPPAPSLHGAYFGLRCHLIAYQITDDKKHLERAVYWARTGLPFIYFWSLPTEPVDHAYIPGEKTPRLPVEQVYSDPRRHAMLYGGLYGYGSSQFTHHWFGILVQWIPLVYADDLLALAEYDESLPWRTISEGIVTSAMWQMYDKAPHGGKLPDAFSLDQWTPSGCAIGPHLMLESLLRQFYGWDWRPQTVVLHDGVHRYHVTSSGRPGKTAISDGDLAFSLSDPVWPHVRAVVTGITAPRPSVTVDGRPLPESKDLEALDECWSRENNVLFVKVKQADAPRRIQIHPGPAATTPKADKSR